MFDSEAEWLDYLATAGLDLQQPAPKAGQNKGTNVTCQRWTSRQYKYNKYNESSLIIHNNTISRLVTVTPGSVGYLVSSEDMKRCTVQYKVTCNTILNLLKGDTNQVMC